jgi:transcriptional regulator with XRE-family HTH domain
VNSCPEHDNTDPTLEDILGQDNQNKSGDVHYVNGEMILEAITRRDISIEQLAQRASVGESTIRNYINSTEQKPWPAKRRKLAPVCKILELDFDSVQVTLPEPTTPNEDVGVCADFRFLGDPKTVRRIDGRWKASSIDVEIEGFITYSSPAPWSADLVIEQFGNRFECRGTDKDDDGVFAAGNLMEDGNFIKFDYWIDAPSLREYGVAMVEYKGCGDRMEGLFMGRDHGHSSNGMVVAKLTLVRDLPTEKSDIPR